MPIPEQTGAALRKSWRNHFAHMIPAQQLFSPREGCVSACQGRPHPKELCHCRALTKPIPCPPAHCQKTVLNHVSQWEAFWEVRMKRPITAGCCRDVTSHVSISRKLLCWLNSQNAGRTKQCLTTSKLFFFFQPNVVSCFNCNFQELY